MPWRSAFLLVSILGGCLAGLLSADGTSSGRVAHTSTTLGLPGLSPPPGNPLTREKVALGRELFFDKRLSRDNSISCATCHDPHHGFSDPHPVSIGVSARMGERNSMTMLNSAFSEPLMWDGRAATLEEQARLAFESPVEFDFPIDQAVEKLVRHGYSKKFERAFGGGVTVERLCQALASYARSLVAGDSPFDRYLFLEDKDAASTAARRGFDVFLKARCDQCHLIMTPGLHPFALTYVTFTDNEFHNLGVGAERDHPDPGRFSVTKDEGDWAAFKTPSLRNVALTAPYFHDGSAPTLMDVVEHYDKGGNPMRNLDPAMEPLELTEEEKRDLVAFLESLTSSRAAELTAEESRIRSDPP